MTDNTSENKKIARNTIFLYGRMIFVLFVSLYTTRVVLNVLGVTDYGIFNVVGGFVSMFAFLNSAMNNTTQRYFNYDRSRGNLDTLKITYSTALQIQILLAAVTFFLLETFGIWYINNIMVIPVERLAAANWVFQFSVLSLVLLVIQIPFSAAIISHEKMDYYAIVSILDVVLKLVTVIVLPFVSYDKLIFYGLFTIMVSFMDFILYYIYAKKNFQEIDYRNVFDKNKFKEMLSFTGWNLFGAFAFTLQGQGLNVLVNSFFGPVVNAARGVAFQIQGAINGFSENIATAFRPQLVESYAKRDYKRTQSLMFSMSKFCYIMVFVLSAPVLIELHNILNLWLDGTIPDYTIPFTFLVVINMLVSCLNLPISQTVQATGKVKYYQILRSIVVASTLPIAWLFLECGANATSVFWTTLLISIVNQPLSMAILHKNFEYGYLQYIKEVINPCILLTIIAPILPIILHLWLDENIWSLILVCGTSVLSSILTIYFIILSSNERSSLKVLVKNKINKK